MHGLQIELCISSDFMFPGTKVNSRCAGWFIKGGEGHTMPAIL